MIYWELFLSFLQVGLFSFGGGYAAMPLIRGQVVTVHHWLSMSEFTDLITISQMTPGPIAVNSASSCDRIIFLKDGKVKEDLKRTGDKEQFYNEIITNWC